LLYNIFLMNKYDPRKLHIKREVHKRVSHSKFIGNSVLAGLIGSGIFIGLNPQENFGGGIISSIVLSGVLYADKSYTQNRVNKLVNRYEEISHAESVPVSQLLLHPNERETQPRTFNIKGAQESMTFAGILGGVSEAGAFLVANSESTNKVLSVGIGAIALIGGSVLNIALNKTVAEDINFNSDLSYRKIEAHYE